MKKDKSLKMRDNSVVAYLRQVSEELGKVTWPSRSEVVRMSGVVVVASLIVGLYIGGIDYLFTNLISLIIK